MRASDLERGESKARFLLRPDYPPIVWAIASPPTLVPGPGWGGGIVGRRPPGPYGEKMKCPRLVKGSLQFYGPTILWGRWVGILAIVPGPIDSRGAEGRGKPDPEAEQECPFSQGQLRYQCSPLLGMPPLRNTPNGQTPKRKRTPFQGCFGTEDTPTKTEITINSPPPELLPPPHPLPLWGGPYNSMVAGWVGGAIEPPTLLPHTRPPPWGGGSIPRQQNEWQPAGAPLSILSIRNMPTPRGRGRVGLFGHEFQMAVGSAVPSNRAGEQLEFPPVKPLNLFCPPTREPAAEGGWE
ncbi:hypothetical protein SUGI_1227140 [Cryptomeria japonica]|uniref:Uncharacterized protein n=1 Tax=Cryptomeria japonica TaxID=3369 RepID=A0AAD3NP41_CRYJA|nr:hypothetical protein SUGI_1227140 [Cryptomeria japonica]